MGRPKLLGVCRDQASTHSGLHLPIVLVVVRHADGRILVHQRSAQKSQPLAFDHVCGAIRSGEEPEAAARREAFEETGATLDSLRFVSSGVNAYGRFRHLYAAATRTPGHELAGDASEVAWVGYVTEEEVGRGLQVVRGFFDDLAAAVPSAVPAPATDRAGVLKLRDRIAETMARADGWDWAASNFSSLSTPATDRYRRCADAVLAALPASVDRATVLNDAADAAMTAQIPFVSATGRECVATWLRRMAVEAQQQTEPEARVGTATPLVCSDERHAAKVAALEQEIRRLGLMVDEYGHGASALSEKLKGVRGAVAFAERVVATSGPGPASAVQAVIDRLRAALDPHVPAVVPGGAGEEPADETREAEGEPTESVIYQVVGDWGVDSADSAEGARAAVAKWLREYPKCGAFAQQRICRDWPDGSEFSGPWTDLPEPAVSQPGKEPRP